MKTHSRFAGLFFCTVLSFATLATAGAQTVFFVGANPAPDHTADGAVMAYLQERYGTENVTYMQASAAVAGDEEAFDVLIISSSLGSGTVRNKFHDTPIPVVNWEEAVADNGAGEYSITEGRTKDVALGMMDIDITIADPVITAGFSVGQTVTIATGVDAANAQPWWSTGAQAPGAVSLAEKTGDPASMWLTTVEAGGELLNGGTAPARRVMIGIQDSTFNLFTDDGKKLFGQSVDWALGLSGGQEMRIRSIDFDADTNMITIVWDSQPGSFYAIDVSTDLTEWPGDIDDGIEGNADGDTTSFSFSAAGLSGRTFFRVRPAQ